MRESEISQEQARYALMQVEALKAEVTSLRELVHKLKNKQWVDFMTKEERGLGHGWTDFMA